ncbi:MAG: GerAB/ArcD/ProY family transporter [Peptococcaceae bacterium]|jgi:spore germination protein (amino acid permease)|nr:spore germination protein [Peptococcaceae bacterium]MDH7524392.1 GerAB/ArcD/ProY family transporter [Peptococcaceae bacterium]
MAMVMIYTGAKAFLGYPRLLADKCLNAGWMAALLGGLAAVVFWLAISALLARFPGKSIIEINEIILGPVLGLGLNALILAYLILSSSVFLRQFSESVIITALPESPLSSLTFLFLITVLVAAYLGLESISRNSYIALPFILVGVAAVLVSLYTFWDVKELFPVLGAGAGPVLAYGLLGASAYGEVLLLAILAPFFSFRIKTLRTVGLISIGVVMLYFAAITAVYLMVIPVPAAAEALSPFYQLSRTIYAGRYYQRLESVFVLFWTYTAFLQLAIGLITTTLAAQAAFKLPYYRPLLPALAVLFLSLALTPASLMENTVIEEYQLLCGGLFTLLVPSGVWALAALKGKAEKNEK